MRDLAPILSLGQLAERPELIDRLPVGVCGALIIEAAADMDQKAALIKRLSTRVATAAISEGSVSARSEELIDARAVAELFHVSPSTIQHKAKREPFKFFVVPTNTRRLLFSRRKIEDYIRREAGRSHEHLALGLRGVNSGRRPQRKGPPSRPPQPLAPAGSPGEGDAP